MFEWISKDAELCCFTEELSLACAGKTIHSYDMSCIICFPHGYQEDKFTRIYDLLHCSCIRRCHILLFLSSTVISQPELHYYMLTTTTTTTILQGTNSKGQNNMIKKDLVLGSF